MKRFATLTAIFLLLAVLLAPASAQTVTGTWKCVAKPEGGASMEFRLELAQKGKEVTGTASRADGSTDIRGGSFENGKLQLLIDADQGTYDLRATLAGNKLTGTLTHTRREGSPPWEGTREGAAVPAASAAPAPSIEGLWKAGQFSFEFKRQDDKLTGRVVLNDGTSIPFSKVSFADGVVKFTVTTNEGSYEAEGKLEGDKLSGSYTTPAGEKRAWEATRS